jgi:hypothetical protein
MTAEEIRQRLNHLAVECGFDPLVVAGKTLDGDVWSVTVISPALQDVCFIEIYDSEADDVQIQFSSTPLALARRFEQTKHYAVLLMRRNGQKTKGFWRFGYGISGECQQFVILEDLETLNAARFYEAAIEVVTEDQWWHDVLEGRARTWAEEPWE